MCFPVWQLERMTMHGWMANSHDPEGGLHEVGIGLAFGAEELCSQIIVLFASLENYHQIPHLLFMASTLRG